MGPPAAEEDEELLRSISQLFEMSQRATLVDLVQADPLTLESLTEFIAEAAAAAAAGGEGSDAAPQPPPPAIARDGKGDTALHHLCRNKSATVDMLRLLLGFQPGMATARNRLGQTALVGVLGAPAAAQTTPTFAAEHCSASVRLVSEASQATCADLAADTATAAVDVELAADCSWQFTLLQQDEADGAEAEAPEAPEEQELQEEQDAGMRVGVATGGQFSGGGAETWTLSTADGQLHGAGAVAETAPCKIAPGDTVKFSLSTADHPAAAAAEDADAGTAGAGTQWCDVSISVNGVEAGVCFRHVRLPVRPYFELAGCRTTVKLGVMTLVDTTQDRAVSMINAIVDRHPSVLHTVDGQSRLPLQIADQNQAPAAVQRLVLAKSVEHGVVWCGLPRHRPSAAAAGEDFGVHVVLHALDRRDRDKELQETVFDVCLAGMSSDRQFRDITSINGLPFDSQDVADVTVKGTHVAFLLADGRVFRLKAKINQKKVRRRPAMLP